MVNMGELFAHARIRNITMDLVPLGESESHYYLKPGDLLFARQSLVLSGAGQCSIFLGNTSPTVFESHLIRCRLDASRVSPAFYFYFFKSQDGRRAIETIVEQGAGASGIRGSDLVNLKVPCPSKSIQEEIALTLGTLDDRIALLRETNVTLESVAQALFKSWFVDFDPVRAKMEGRVPDGVDEATVALFPHELEESALGLVPRGWGDSPVYELATYINGAAYKAFAPNADRRGHPIVKIAELKAGVTPQTAYSDVDMPSKYLIETGDILFSWSGNPDTSIDTFVWVHEPAWLNQHIFRVLPSCERSFVLQMLRHLRPVFTELARNKQTTGLGHVTVADLKRLHCIKPPPAVLKQFDQVAQPIQEKILSNEQQAQTLSTLRDTLLPRLISGQLQLPEVQAEHEH